MFKWAKDLNSHFAKEDIQIASKQVKRWSTLLAIVNCSVVSDSLQPHVLYVARQTALSRDYSSKNRLKKKGTGNYQSRQGVLLQMGAKKWACSQRNRGRGKVLEKSKAFLRLDKEMCMMMRMI